MEYENIEQSVETTEQPVETTEQPVEVFDVTQVDNVKQIGQEPQEEEETEDEPREELETEEESREEVETEEESREEEESEEEELIDEEEIEEPKSTVIQVVPSDSEDSDSVIYELDVNSLNIMAENAADALLAVSPTSNDYFSFIESPVADYFAGVMATLPLNQYRAYHLRHWVSNSSYNSYYDDYYYLFFDYPNEDCIELHKPYNSNQYIYTKGTAEILSSSITYGSDKGLSDLRNKGGGSYVLELSAVCVLACMCVLYIVNAMFRHLKS